MVEIALYMASSYHDPHVIRQSEERKLFLICGEVSHQGEILHQTARLHNNVKQ